MTNDQWEDTAVPGALILVVVILLLGLAWWAQ